MSTRLVSWNILQGGGRRIADIRQALCDWQPDMVALQEYRHNTAAVALADCFDELELTHTQVLPMPARVNGVLLASRLPMLAVADNVPTNVEPHLLSTARLCAKEGQKLTLLTTHLPHKHRQIAYFDYLLGKRQWLEGNAIMIGDFNCGIPFVDSETRSFDNTHLFQQLLQQGWCDVWRDANPDAREFSWFSQKGNGFRYDHCLASPTVTERITSIRYDHSVRTDGLSDHSALLVDLDLT